jgi:cob(I)alamin adenosyltransferase
LRIRHIKLEGGNTLIQVYTGNGKGKTTCALGLALRASGAGLKVYICQFIKGRPYSEFDALKKLKNIKIEQCGSGCFIKHNPSRKDMDLANCGWEKVIGLAKKKSFDVIILDEINVALKLKLLSLAAVIKFLKSTPKKIEIILTGRSAPKEIKRIADLVSEIREVKHYFKKGIKARKGIEF